MLRFGSVKCGKTAFSLLAVALTLQYLCIRYAALGKLKASFLSSRLQYLCIRYAALGKSKASFISARLQYLCIRKVETITGTAARYRRSLPPV